MAGSLNKVMLIGNLGADPEVRSTSNGAQVANFRVACTENWTDQSGQRQERTEWVMIVAWRKLAEIAQKYLRKGSKVYVEGKLQTRSWEDRDGSGKRYATEVVCETFLMLDGRPEGSDRPGRGRRAAQPGADDGDDGGGQAPQPGADDDLPF